MNFEPLLQTLQVEELFRILWISYPIIPLITMMIALALKYLFAKQKIIYAAGVSLILQILTAAAIILLSREISGERYYQLMDSRISITFHYGIEKLYFMGALTVPMILALFRLKSLNTPEMYLIFLFYLAGCSGLIVTGDVFNFFVFYELMIMGAYVLISVKHEYSASVKYMVFGAVSSAIFLGGIVVLYSSGAYFSFSFLYQIHDYETYPMIIAIYLFCIAFFIKGAFLPVSGWVAPCHSAANSLVSSFLASYTIFTGILGLYYLVILPAEILGADQLLTIIRIISLLTIGAASLIIFFEREYKRVIAASTVYTIGIVGLLMSHGLQIPALWYVLIHAPYKSLLFYMYEEFEDNDSTIKASLLLFILFGIALLYTGGFFPSATSTIKLSLGSVDIAWYKWFILVTAGILIGGFTKYRFKVRARGIPSAASITALLIIIGYSSVYFSSTGFPLPSWRDMLIEYLVLLAAAGISRTLYMRAPVLHNVDKKTIYRNLNQELLLIFVILITVGIWMFFPYAG